MRDWYHTLVLAPHLDDAALSCGGRLADLSAAGEPALVVTLMAGDPPSAGGESPLVAALHARWRLDAAAVAARRAEDRRACALLGVDWLHGALPDCIYRADPLTGAPYYQENEALFGAPDPGEVDQLVAEIAALLATLPPAGRVLAPLTVGGHVDHRLTRLAAERHYGTAVWYYEDYPYARESGALDEVLPPPRSGWIADVVPISAAGLQRKVAAVQAYESQVSTFFADTADLTAQLAAYAALVGGERFWRRATV